MRRAGRESESLPPVLGAGNGLPFLSGERKGSGEVRGLNEPAIRVLIDVNNGLYCTGAENMDRPVRSIATPDAIRSELEQSPLASPHEMFDEQNAQ